MKSSNHFYLGLLFIVALGILGYFTIVESDFEMFGEQHQLIVQFPEADGLREGDAVLVAGVRWGKVTTIDYDPVERNLDKRITVHLSLDAPVELRAGHEILIEDATLLGGKNLSIDPGPPGGEVIALGTILQGDVQLNVIEAAGELIANNGEALTEAIDGIRNVVANVEAGRGAAGKIFSDEEFAAELDRTITSFADTGENLSAITGRLERGEGTFGKLLVDDEMYVELKDIASKLDTLLTEANGAVTDLRAGKGLLGAALTDEALSQDVKDGIRNLREIIERANRGEGTLGKILVEDTIAVSLDEVLGRLSRGEGTLGKLFAEEEVYEDIRQISSDLRDIVATVREGRGTVGKLIMEEQLYYELLKAVGLLTRSLEEYREAAPISTMTSVIFGAF